MKTGHAEPAGVEDLVRRAEAAGVRLVRFLYCDQDGLIRGKASGLGRLGERLETGIGLAVAMQAFTLLDRLAPVEGMGPVGEIRLVPDLDTFTILPYLPATAAVLVDMRTLDGGPYAADGRHFLRRMIERAAGLGLELVAAFEPEWALARREGEEWVPLDRSGCFTTAGMNAAAPVVAELVEALEAQGLSVEQYYAELGWGQQELSIRHAPALRAADHHLLYRETVRGVALRHGLAASFAPKPWPDQPGNGCHLHLSAWDREGRGNRFHDPARPYGLSELGGQFVAGILRHLPALLALTCPSVNSYRRLQPQTWASAYTVWGPDNREAAVRVASGYRGHEPESVNVELKASDSSANPHLALGAVLAAGLDGIDKGLAPPPPTLVDPHALGDEERRALGASRYPTGLGDALECLRRDPVLGEAMGECLLDSYLAVKTADIEAFAAAEADFEFRHHFDRF
jgi:glutamine synthetase